MNDDSTAPVAETFFVGTTYFFTVEAVVPTDPHPVCYGRPPRLTPEELGLPPAADTAG